MELARALERGVAVMDPVGMSADEALAALAQAAGRALGLDAGRLHEALRRRERLCPTALPEGVALPHAILPEIERTLVVPMVSRPGVQMDATEVPSRIIIGLFGAEGNPSEHIALLGRVARAAQDPETRSRMLAAPSGADLIHVLLERDAALV